MSCHTIGVTMTAIGMTGIIIEMTIEKATMTVRTVAEAVMAAMTGITESLRGR